MLVHGAEKAGGHLAGLVRGRALLQHPLAGKVQGEQGEIEQPGRIGLQLPALVPAERPGKTADHAGHRVHRLAAQPGEHVLAEPAQTRHLRGQFRLLAGQADHVAHAVVAVGPEDKIRRGQKEEVEELVRDVGEHQAEFAQQAAGRRRFDREAAVHGPGRGQVVHPRTDAADAGDDARQFLGRPADDELLEAAQAGDFHPGVVHRAGSVQVDVDTGVALDAGHGLDGDNPGHDPPWKRSGERGPAAGWSSPWAPQKRSSERRSTTLRRSTPWPASAFIRSSSGLEPVRTGP